MAIDEPHEYSYRVSRVVVPEEIRAHAIANLKAYRSTWHPAVTSLVLVVILMLPVLIQRGIGPAWLSVLLVAAVAVAGVNTYRAASRDRDALARRLEYVRSSTEAEHHQLRLDRGHLIVWHEHGWVVLVPVGPGRTFCFDVSSVTIDDPFEPFLRAIDEDGTAAPSWSWWQFGDPIMWLGAIEMIGTPIAVDIGSVDSIQEYKRFFDVLGDPLWVDRVLDRDFAAIVRTVAP